MKKTSKSKKPVVPDYPGKMMDDLSHDLGMTEYDNDPLREIYKKPVEMQTKPNFVEDDEDRFGMRNFDRVRKTDFEIKKGGRIKIPKTKVSTGQRNSKKSSNW
jgi:hypothetical protein